MAKIDLISKADYSFARQMMIFKENIGKHSVAMGLTPEQVAAQAADADYYNYVVQSHGLMQTHMNTMTVFKRSLRWGDVNAVAHDFMAANLPDAPTAVAPGLEKRFRTLVRQVKASANYDKSIGVELGIEAGDPAAPDYTAIAPKITAVVIGDHVYIGWDWQGHRAFLDLCEIQAERVMGAGFEPLVHSTTPGYNDTTPFPAAPAIWRYRAIYRVGNGVVGVYSRVVSVTVPQ